MCAKLSDRQLPEVLSDLSPRQYAITSVLTSGKLKKIVHTWEVLVSSEGFESPTGKLQLVCFHIYMYE